ncbi:small glutamine-rich tetratricopeptide repeat protein [Trypanosoma grayi]|uniref:small glutamine-rich tetratricopeptide repeat protein n=1 Tax=Trypanosoma grayi TaxID=71804 RepID=UPI0004F49816|nr:small glutamine-rich tetratricopeptide repeat protein [Trypanosoma grayi]KEG14869.1 small glutamine-rich tetratricopeptide repeat protein [Trypanosoma grayi]
MSDPMTSDSTPLQPVTEEHRKLVFSFLRMLRTVDSPNPSRVDAVAQLLGEEYGVDPAGVGGVHDTDVDLLAVFRQAVQNNESTLHDEKFQVFLDLLVKKGYFNNAAPGSEEYKSRLEKARQKFEKRNNPYEGMTAEEIKNKGNDLMGEVKYKEAIAYYTKAIEMEPENHIFFANRAAAHTHLKDYRSALLDCERAIAIDPNYPKGYARMGTVFFYQEKYSSAVDAFTKACELDPENERYKEDLKQAEDKMKLSGNTLAGAGGMGGFPMGAGMPDLSQISQMMSNPQFMEATTRMMENPQFSQMVANMASRFGGPNANPEDLAQLMSGANAHQTEKDGRVATPFGYINREALEKLQQEEVQKNPKFREIMEDVQQNGFGAFQKYIGDPDVMDLMIKFQNVVMGGSDNATS